MKKEMSQQGLRKYRKSLLAISISAATLALSPSSLAQDDGDLEEITVTGSRIVRTDGMAEPIPVTSLSTDELDNFEPGGTIAEQLDALPQFFGTGTAQRGGNTLFGDGGGSYLDMRGLGRNRTLVLLDGSRMVPADKRSTVNIDNIPTALLKSVDVVTGGASAAYGADALGGVTNFILDRRFEGLKLTASTGMNEFNEDGKNWNFSAAGGRQFGNLHVIGSIEAREIDQITREAEDLDSDWFQRWGHVTNPAWSSSDPAGTNPRRITVPWLAPTNITPAGSISGTGTSLDGMTFTDDGSAVRDFVLGNATYGSTTSGGSDAAKYSAATPIGQAGNGVITRSGFLALNYDVSDTFSVFGQVLVGRSESDNAAVRTSFRQSSAWALTIFRDNAFLPASVAQIMDDNGVDSFTLSKVGSYPGQLAPGSTEYSKTVFTTESWSVGFNKEFSNGWDLRASWQTGESNKRGGKYDGLRVDREALARDAVIDPATGNVVCNVQLVNPSLEQLAASPEIQGILSSRTGEQITSPIGLDNTISDCVPYNALGVEGLSAESAAYMQTPKISDSWVKQDFAEVLLTGEAHEGWGYGPIMFATGLTWREQSFSDEAVPFDVDFQGPPQNDPALGIRGIAGTFETANPNLHFFSTIRTISGEYDVWEAFGEVQLPIWESDSGQQRLGGTLAYRSSDYSSSGRVESWKAGFEFQVFEDLRIRATKSSDVREASFAERFDGQTGGANIDDPFTGQLNVNVSTIRGGNPDLAPEYADTTVVGFVYEPSWFEGFRISTDWYEVEISDAVATLSIQDAVDQCFISNILCENLSRDTGGTLTLVKSVFLNLAESKVEGIDLEMVYQMEPNFFGNHSENLSIRALAGKLRERTNTAPGGLPVNLIGSSTRPEYTGLATVNYNVGAWGVQFQQRFMSETVLRTTWTEGVDVDDNTVPFYSYSNLLFSYTGETSRGGEWSAKFAINNAFNKNPPIIAGYRNLGGAQTGALNNFDEWGRRYQLTVGLSF